MRKEFGKWLLDIAKYMVTAILLSSVFSDVQSVWMYVSVCAGILLTLICGLILVKENRDREA